MEAPSLPHIAILVAARNEAHQIENCLTALSHLDYPAGKWEVWIGNDRSTDNTGQVVEDFIQHKAHFHVLHIEREQSGEAIGKANVLAQLAHQAVGEVFLFTDADIQVKPCWAKGMLQGWNPKVGIITGFTLVESDHTLGNLQALDWTWALTLVKTSTDLGIPTTAMGNNMLVAADAYWATGGYEELPFSVTEDYALFKEVVARGYGFKQLINRDVLATTPAIDTFPDLIKQRQRWMHGAVQVPWYLQSGLVLQLAWTPLMLGLLYFSPLWAGILWLVKIALQIAVMAIQLLRLGRPQALKYALLYEPYALVTYTLMAYSYFWGKPVQWKGRTFDK